MKELAVFGGLLYTRGNAHAGDDDDDDDSDGN